MWKGKRKMGNMGFDREDGKGKIGLDRKWKGKEGFGVMNDV